MSFSLLVWSIPLATNFTIFCVIRSKLTAGHLNTVSKDRVDEAEADFVGLMFVRAPEPLMRFCSYARTMTSEVARPVDAENLLEWISVNDALPVMQQMSPEEIV